MKNYAAIIFTCTSVMLFALLSCNNNGSGKKSTRDILIGNWKLHTMVNEADTSAVTNTTLDKENIMLTLNSDGKGFGSGGDGDTTAKKSAKRDFFTWSLTHNDTYLDFTDSAAHNTSLQIITITDKKLVIRDVSVKEQPERITFIKQ